MKAIKGNKEYTIDEKQKAFYVDEGYDIIGEDGEVITYGKGKTVPYETYISVVRRIEFLEGINTELRTQLEATGQINGQAPEGDVVPEGAAVEPAEGATAEAKEAAKKGKG